MARFLADRIKEDLKNPAFKKAFKKSDLPIRLAIAIAKFRQKLGLTQDQLAKRAGLHQQAISRLEKAIQPNVGIQTLDRIAHALHRPIAEFFSE